MLARRKKLMLIYGLAGAALTAAAAAWVLVTGEERDYRPGEKVEGVTSTLSRSLPPDGPSVRFEDKSEEAGIDFHHFHGDRSTQLPEDMGSGAAWGDYDNDGNVDLFLCNIAGPLTAIPEELASSPASNRLYRNRGDGTFEDVTEGAGLGDRSWSMGAAWGDFDSDGFLDLVVTRYGGVELFRNRRDGTFARVTRELGLAGFDGFWAGASWADYDRDGDLDLYVTGYLRYEFRPEEAGRGTRQYQAVVPYTLNPSSYPPERNLLFRNDGSSGFTEVAEEKGVANAEGRSLSASWCDFDEDGWIDLYVANDVSDNVFYRNQGNGTFEEISHAAWVADYRGAMGLAVADWDGDSDQDLFVTHWVAQENALYSNLRFAFEAQDSDPGDLRFIDVADMVGLGQIALDYIGWGTFFFDYDNDGRPDLFVANGSTFQDEKDAKRLVPMRNLLFWNGGVDRGFFEVGEVAGEILLEKRVGRGAAAADFDNDGDVDLVVVSHGGRPFLLRNEGGNRNDWLRVEARSRQGNRFAVGAKVSVEANGMTQTSQIGSQSSYLSQNPYEAHFGLGETTRVDRVRVVFPSGKVVELTGVTPNQRLTLREESR